MPAIRSATAFCAYGVFFVATLQPSMARAFEGHIQAAITRGGATETYLYTISTNRMRIERGESEYPYARDIIALDTGEVVLLYPHNRSFVRLKNGGQNAASPSSNPPGMPPGVGPRPPPGNPSALSEMPPMPAGFGPQGGAPMPVLPRMPMEPVALVTTNQTTNLLGYVCTRYDLKLRGEVMEIWATDQLPPFQAWQPNQPHRLGPRMVEEEWAQLLKARKLFPLLAVLKSGNGGERLRFEVKAVKPERIEDQDGALFQPPEDYREIEPLPF